MEKSSKIMHVGIGISVITGLIFLISIFRGVSNVQTTMDKIENKQIIFEKNQHKSMHEDSIIKKETKQNRFVDSLKFEYLQYTVDKNVEILQGKPKTKKK